MAIPTNAGKIKKSDRMDKMYKMVLAAFYLVHPVRLPFLRCPSARTAQLVTAQLVTAKLITAKLVTAKLVTAKLTWATLPCLSRAARPGAPTGRASPTSAPPGRGA